MMTKQVISGLQAGVALPLALLVICCWVGAAEGKATTVSIAKFLGRSDAAAKDLLRRCSKDPKTHKNRVKCTPIEAYIARCVTVHNWRCLRCTYNPGKGISSKESTCTQVRSPGLTTLRKGQAVCNPGVEPVRGSTKQDVRSCRPGHAKHGPGNFKCSLCHGRGYTPRIGATYCRICPAGYTINKLRTTCTPPPKKPTLKKPPPKSPPPKSPPPKRPPPSSPPPKRPPPIQQPPPPPACAGLKQEIFRLNSDIQAFTSNDLQSDTPLPIGKPCPGACTYPYDPNMANDTRQVDEPTLGHCNFNSTAPCGSLGPTASPYTHGSSQACPASYTADYRGGTFGVPPGDLQGPGLTSNYIVRWTGYITLPASGIYQFSAFADDGMYMDIDGQRVLEISGFVGTGEGIYNNNFAFQIAGVFPFEMQYYQRGNTSSTVLYWNWDGTDFDITTADACFRRRHLMGKGQFFPPGGAAYRAVPKSAFCAGAPPPSPPLPP